MQTPNERLALIRKELGYERKADFAEKVGIERSTYDKMEKGPHKPSADNLEKIAAKFSEVNLNWLLLGQGPMLFSEGVNTATPGAQLPPQVPSKLEPLQAPAVPLQQPTAEELRNNMRIVAESPELREVKSERDHLRTMNEALLAIIRNFSGGDAAAAGALGKAEASSHAADLRETVDEIAESLPMSYRIMAMKPVGFAPSFLRLA